MLKISKFSLKKYWIFKYSNNDFDEILITILNKMDYDYIELTLWEFQVNLFNKVEYKYLVKNIKFSTIVLNKENILKIFNSPIYEEIRLFEINMYINNIRYFNIKSDNYSEYTKIIMEKVIEEEKLSELLNNMFNEKNK